MEKLTRGEFLLLIGAAILTPGCVSRQLLKNTPQEPPRADTQIQETPIYSAEQGGSLQKKEKIISIADIRGLHDTPIEGGSLDKPLAVNDAKRLGMKFLLCLNPTEEMLRTLKNNSNITPISRAIMKNNKYDRGYLEPMTRKISQYYGEESLIVPYNETNLTCETGEVLVSAEEHIVNDFIPAARLIIYCGGIPILTPLAQTENPLPSEGLEDVGYFISMIKTLQKYDPKLLDVMKIGLHSYISKPGEDIWTYPKKINRIIKDLAGKEIDIYITEAGLRQTAHEYFDDKTFAEETVRINMGRTDLPVKALCNWIYSGYAQRPESDKNAENKVQLEGFEKSAWRKEKGKGEETVVFRAIERLKKSA